MITNKKMIVIDFLPLVKREIGRELLFCVLQTPFVIPYFSEYLTNND
jgi:hypothetical protein